MEGLETKTGEGQARKEGEQEREDEKRDRDNIFFNSTVFDIFLYAPLNSFV